MRTAMLITVALVGLTVCACSKKSDQASAGSGDASPAAVNAAADASQVTSIPGYTPDTGNSAAGNAP